MRRRKGFTLIELLVVIAIIAILAAIVFPVITRAMNKAKQTTQISNIRQISMAMIMYGIDNNDGGPFNQVADAATGQEKLWWPQKLYRGGYIADPYTTTIFEGGIGIATNHAYINAMNKPWPMTAMVKSPEKVMLVSMCPVPANPVQRLGDFTSHPGYFGKITWGFTDGHAAAVDKKRMQWEYENADPLTGDGAWWYGYWGRVTAEPNLW